MNDNRPINPEYWHLSELIDVDKIQRLQEIAAERAISLEALVQEAVDQWLERERYEWLERERCE
jgi:hypothetical protein